jgi:prolyl-tRNA synthetase
LKALLEAGNVRCHVDNRDCYTPGWKYNDWEMKGVPVRLELGPKDFANEEVRVVIRYSNEKY